MTHRIREWDEQREDVFLDRYSLKDENGIATERKPEAMWGRVSRGLGRTPDEVREFYFTLEDFRFVPAGRILNGVGSHTMNTYYNCFVLGVGSPGMPRDSREAIMHTVTRMVEITSRGGGVGINWGALRPSGVRIRGVDGRSSGAVSWMKGADQMVDSIRQGGSRTAALMYILPSWHPDVLEFVNTAFLRANHSVGIQSGTMARIARGEVSGYDHETHFPDVRFPGYDSLWDGDLVAWGERNLPLSKNMMKIPLQYLWQQICEGAARTGNPGLVFLERANEESNTKHLDRLVSTNPCGEQFLPENGACNLGAVNLVAHYDPNERDGINWSRLFITIHNAVAMLDSVIDASPVIDHGITTTQAIARRIGIGTMGLADLLLLRGIRYGSDESLEYIGRLYRFIQGAAYTASASLAERLGPAPGWSPDAFFGSHRAEHLDDDVLELIDACGLRNLTLTSQAPTGTTSVLAGVSSGIEPVFAAEYTRNDATGKHTVRHPLFGGSADHLVTAGDVTIDEHIRVQGAIQRWSDNAVSKTINLPRGSDWRDVARAYILAWEEGCKGITVFVDGSREGVLEAGPTPQGGHDPLDCPDGSCAF